jgi:hypothetical protein
MRVMFKKGKVLAGGGPDLISDDGHHEYQVEAESPDDGQFGAIEVAAGNVVLFRSDELVGFEGGQDQGLIGGGDGMRSSVDCFRHHAVLSAWSSRELFELQAKSRFLTPEGRSE